MLPKFNWYKIRESRGTKFAFAIMIATLVYLDAGYFHGIFSKSLWTINLIFTSFILSIFIILSGLIVVRSLFKASVGLSLLIFLNQSYCDAAVPRTESSDQALRVLLLIGLSYILYDFLSNIWNEAVVYFSKFKEKRGKFDWQGIVVSIFLIIFIMTFIYYVYLVINPIVSIFCIFKK